MIWQWLYIISKERRLPGKAAERRQAVKRNIIIAAIIGTLATYLPFWLWKGCKQALGAVALSIIVWICLDATEPERRKIL